VSTLTAPTSHNVIRGERLTTGVPGHGGARRGAASDGAPCKCGREHWGPWATQGAPRSSRQSEVVAVWPIVTHTPTQPHIPPHRAPPYVDIDGGGRLAMVPGPEDVPLQPLLDVQTQ
jgi:hypothetical protein